MPVVKKSQKSFANNQKVPAPFWYSGELNDAGLNQKVAGTIEIYTCHLKKS